MNPWQTSEDQHLEFHFFLHKAGHTIRVMKIRYRISTLVIILTVAIILLINLSYVRILTRAADELIARYLRGQMTSILVDVPPEDEIDWDDMQSQTDRALRESEDLLYIAVYNADNNEIRLMSINIARIQSLTDNGVAVRSSEIAEGLGRGDLDIREAREIDILAQSDPPTTSLRVVIGYTFPISGQMSSFILWIALILVLVFTAVAVVGSFFLAGGITRPIRRLVSAMQSVSEGKLDTIVRVRSRDEVGLLARVFNKMTYQLREKTEELEQLNRTLEERVQLGVAELRSRDEVEKQRLTREIQRARDVQMGLLPQRPPDTPGFDIWGICLPANEVGGDFFDYLSLGADRMCIALGDVSGKGMKGAMNAVMTYAMLHTQTQMHNSASTIISELNVALSSRLQEATFTALSLGIIDIKSKEIQLCNAGNPYPILLRQDKASLLELSGMPLGIISEIEHDEAQLALAPGDVLILYSDGIPEAMSPDNRVYSMDTLRELVETFEAGLSAQAVVEGILHNVKEFVGDSPRSDDVTIVAVRVHGAS